MNKKLTRRIIDCITAPQQGQQFVWDAELKGFGIRITPTRKTYIAQGKANGRTIRVTIGPCNLVSIEAARLEAKNRLFQMCCGVFVNQQIKKDKTSAVTLDKAYQAYIASKPFSDNTLRDYAKAMRIAFKNWSSKPILNIKPIMIVQRFDELSKRSSSQTNQMFRLLRAVLAFAKNKYANDDQPLFLHNPCDCLTALGKWHTIKRRTRHLEPQQLKNWFEAMQVKDTDTLHQRTVKAFCGFILLTGCREQEAAKLKWGDVNFEKRTVIFRKTKNGKSHTLPIGKWLTDYLLLQKEADSLSSFVFPSDNKYGHMKYHHNAIAAISKQCGIPFTLHDLRRTFASIVSHRLEKNFSSYILKRLLNHSNSGDVTAGYVQCGIEDLREPMEMVERYLISLVNFPTKQPPLDFHVK
jgi:integrase